MDPGPPELEMRYRRFLEGRGDAIAPLLCYVRSDRDARAGTGAWAALIISRIFFLKGDVGLSFAYLRIASSLSRHGESDTLRLGVLVNRALLLKARGKTREAAELLRRIVDRALRSGEIMVAAKAASNCALCLVRGEDPTDAVSYIGLAERFYSAEGCASGLIRIALTRALLDAGQKRIDEAVDGVARALGECDGTQFERETLIGNCILAELFLGRGRLEEARYALDKTASMRDALERFGPQRLRWLRLEREFNEKAGRMEESRRFFDMAEGLRRRLALSRLCGDFSENINDVSPGIAREAAPARIIVRCGTGTAGVPEEAFITGDRRMIELLEEIKRAAPLSAPILLRGESGVGKDVIARLVHVWSARAHEPFVPLNAAALPVDLFESLAFGHAKGAFTGAVNRRAGFIEAAGRGTLFLDEVGELPAAMQAKLLRLIDRGEFIPLGETSPRRSEARIVAATNRDLKAACAAGDFRADLYYRLAAIVFRIPPLRERREDIPLLAAHFLEKIRALHRTGPLELHEDALRLLSNHDWPGNARELESEILQAALRAKGSTLRICHFSPSLIMSRASRPSTAQGGLQSKVAATRRAEILEALRASAGNRSMAARLLGLRRTTLLGMMKRLDLGS